MESIPPFPPVDASIPLYVRAYAAVTALPALPRWRSASTGSYFTSEYYAAIPALPELPELPEFPDAEEVRMRTGASLSVAWGATVSAACALVAAAKRVSNRGSPPQEEGFFELEHDDAAPPAPTPRRKYARAGFDDGE